MNERRESIVPGERGRQHKAKDVRPMNRCRLAITLALHR